jgi:hypothetical protein
MAIGVPTMREAERLTGRAYCPRTHDCMHLAVAAQRELWGRHVASAVPARHPVRADDQAAWLDAWAGRVARRLLPTQVPHSGCAVLFVTEGQWHIGTLLVDASGQRWVLHVRDDGMGSRIEPLRVLASRGLHPEGYYEWIDDDATPGDR